MGGERDTFHCNEYKLGVCFAPPIVLNVWLETAFSRGLENNFFERLDFQRICNHT